MKIAGIVLIILQIIALAGGALEDGGMSSGGGLTRVFYMLGYFLPGIIGVILLIKGINKEKSTEE